METHRLEVGVGALPQLEEVGVPHTVELADMAHMLEVEVVEVPRILGEVAASRTQAPHAPPEEVHTLAGVGVVGEEHSGCGDGSGPYAWCAQCARP